MWGNDAHDPIETVRRRFLAGLVGLGAMIGSGGAARGAEAGSSPTEPKIRQRLTGEYRTRQGNARRQLVAGTDDSPHPSNDRLNDEAVVVKFGKSLAHDDDTGLPMTDAYDSLVRACETGSGFDAIQQAFEGATGEDVPDSVSLTRLTDGSLDSKPLVQPETAWSYQAEGASTAELRIAVAPAFDDPETGAEIVELYWRALTRDVNFQDYDDSELVQAAADELDGLDEYNGPGADGTVTTGNVFRGVTAGSETGPYVSQFLWKDRNLGRGPVDQRIQPQVIDGTASLDPGETLGPPTDYMTTVEDWLKVQKGVVPPLDDSLPGNEYDDDRRYIVTGRDMCERVHDDPPYRQVQKAAQVLIFTMNAPLDEGIPYTLKPFEKPSESRRDVDSFTAQTTLPFNEFGPLWIEKKVLEAAEHGQKAAWHKKWNVHRRLRPEEYAGRVQAVKEDGDGLVVPDAVGGTAASGPGNGNKDDNGNGNGNGEGDDNGNGNGNGNGDGGDDGEDDGNDDASYPIPDNLLDSEALELTSENYGTYLLPQAYAEGSPTHPSYPAGHSVVAGAGVTVLKAVFDGDYVFPTDQKVVPTRDGDELVSAAETAEETKAIDVNETLTVRGELNKLASNMALGRNRAGIHYRTDGIEGLRLGEAAAVRFLQDQLTLPDRVGDVTLTFESFDGEERTVEPTG